MRCTFSLVLSESVGLTYLMMQSRVDDPLRYPPSPLDKVERGCSELAAHTTCPGVLHRFPTREFDRDRISSGFALGQDVQLGDNLPPMFLGLLSPERWQHPLLEQLLSQMGLAVGRWDHFGGENNVEGRWLAEQVRQPNNLPRPACS